MDLNNKLHTSKQACEYSNKVILIAKDKKVLRDQMRKEIQWYFDTRVARGSRELNFLERLLGELVEEGYDIIKVRDYGK